MYYKNRQVINFRLLLQKGGFLRGLDKTQLLGTKKDGIEPSFIVVFFQSPAERNPTNLHKSFKSYLFNLNTICLISAL